MRQFRLIPLLAALLLLLTACGGAASYAPVPEVSQSSGGAAAPAAEPQARDNAAIEEAPAAGADPAAPQQPASQRLVIKSASLSIEVEDVAVAEATLRARAEQLGGYIVSVQTSGSGAYLTSVITFRVPAERFEDALTGVEGLAHEVYSRTVSGDDVTEEFVDLESRLRNLEATRDRLLDLLNKATRVEDALQVNQALTDVQGEIEQIQGRMKYLRQSAAFSTVSAELRPVPPPPTIVEPDSWQPLRVAQEALAGLVEFAQALGSLAIVFAVWSPVWLPILLVARWGLRRLGARKPRVAAPPPPPPAAEGKA